MSIEIEYSQMVVKKMAGGVSIGQPHLNMKINGNLYLDEPKTTHEIRKQNRRNYKKYNSHEVIVSTSYLDRGTDPLWPRLERAALNQINEGGATISRYAIWANTVRDNALQALNEIEKGSQQNAKKSIVRVINSLSAFADIQQIIDSKNN